MSKIWLIEVMQLGMGEIVLHLFQIVLVYHQNVTCNSFFLFFPFPIPSSLFSFVFHFPPPFSPDILLRHDLMWPKLPSNCYIAEDNLEFQILLASNSRGLGLRTQQVVIS